MHKHILGIIILISFAVNSAHAETFTLSLGRPGDGLWSLQRQFESWQEDLTFDSLAKKELVAKHAMERQVELEKCGSCTSNAIDVIAKVREEKLAKVEEIKNEPSPFDALVSQINQAAEIDDIRKAYADFRSGNYDSEELETRVNSLESVKKNCNGRVSIHALEINRTNAYEKLQEMCPKLRHIPLLDAQNMIGK